MTGTQRQLSSNIGVRALGIGILSFLSPTLISATTTDPNDGLCLTPECIKAAARVLSNIHPEFESIDPCDKFDQYVCGGFSSRYPAEPVYTTLKYVGDSNKATLRSILESPFPKNANSTAEDESIFDMLVTNYNSCMNNDTVESSGLGEIPGIVQKIAELFPIEDADYASNDTITEEDYDALADATVYLAKIGVPLFGEFWTNADTQFPDVIVPRFGPNLWATSDHALPAQGGISDFVAAEGFDKEVPKVLELILPAGPAVNASSQLARSLVDFMTAFAQIELPPLNDVEGLPFMYHSTTVSEAVEVAPALVLDKVITALAPPNYDLDRMVFRYPDMYANISALVSDTPRSTLQALMMFLAYKSLEPYIAGSSALSPERWEFCYSYVDSSLPWIASKFFVEAAYNKERRDYIRTMAEELKSSFEDRTSKLQWIQDETKALIQEKASEILTNIGYPEHTPNTLNATDLALYYSPINITTSLSHNVLSIREWALSHAWDLLSFPADITVWPEQGVHAYLSNARYYSDSNQINLPAGIAQEPIFFDDVPSYIAYGGIGVVAGHEVTHGFDANGRKFNQNRQYKDWWDSESVASFDNRTLCFIKQYSDMQATDHRGTPLLNVTDNQPLYVDGAFTLSENIADAGGVANAFSAWQKHEQSNPSQKLPGLEKFTKEQLFFVSAGQTWCSKSTAEQMTEDIKTDSHAPPFARILGIAQNSRAFREVWQCAKKEPVCELW